MKIKRALLSVTDKTGLVDFAKRIHAQGVELISTGGTSQCLKEAGIPVTMVSEVTGFPEIMDGRVKTLNPLIYGGILAVRDNPEHQKDMQDNHIQEIDLIVVNLYPFSETIARPDVTLAEAIENIDIGGPSMIRAAAKNHAYVTVVVNPQKYEQVAEAIEKDGEVSEGERRNLAWEAFAHTAAYDSAIANYLSQPLREGEFPSTCVLALEKVDNLRYGENPHQAAAFYKWNGFCSGLANMKQHHGKELSYNNLVDAQAAWKIAGEFGQPAAVVIKHTNPCGTAFGSTITEAVQLAIAADPISAYGGIMAINGKVDKNTAQALGGLFLEAILAPGYTLDSLEILKKRKNLRILELPIHEKQERWLWKPVGGGMLVQTADLISEDPRLWETVSRRQVSLEEMNQLEFAWKVVKHVKSNGIVLVKGSQTIGVGAGQMNRVGAAEIALRQAGEKAAGAFLASDAFLPFADTVELAAKWGIAAIIQPGGSIRDKECIEAADACNMAMIFTGIRHFNH